MNNIEKLIVALLVPAQDIENALQQLKLYRLVDTAVGAQLDILGRIVGQARNGLVGDTYRRYLRARIVANFSDGVVEDLIKVVDFVIYDADAEIVISGILNATARLRVDGIAISDEIGAIVNGFVNDTRAAGVRVITQWAVSEPSQVFKFDSGPGFDQGHLATSLD